MNRYNMEAIESFNIIKKKITIPDAQRLIDTEHFNELLEYQKEHYSKNGFFFFPTPLIICQLEDEEYIIDGQHRLKCIEVLTNEKKYPIFYVSVVYIKVKDKKEIEEKYIAINKNKPVQLFSTIDIYKSFYKPFEEYLNKNYAKYMKNTDSPRVPNFNVKHLLKYMDDAKIAYKIDYKKFIEEFEKINKYYKEHMDDLSTVFKGEKLKEIVKNEKCLLLFYYKKYEWTERIIYVNEKNVEYKDISHQPENYRIKIKKPLRTAVWKKRNGDIMTGKCYCCDNVLEFDDFHCGHINSVFFKGETILSNLEPICQTCNLDMGIKNLNDYKNELKKEML